MIIVTGSKGFIGQNFLKVLKDKEIKEVEKNDIQSQASLSFTVIIFSLECFRRYLRKF